MSKIRVMCVDGKCFIEEALIAQFIDHEKAMDLCSDIVDTIEKHTGKDTVSFNFN